MNTVKTKCEAETTAFHHVASPAEVDAARFYEDKFVPALFKYWSPRVIEAADIVPGHRVLDIACGTGVVTRDIAAIVGYARPPVGLDLSAGMLEVARSIAPQVEWRQGDADHLPFADGSFDRVVCQYGLMFFRDPVRALSEMLRVLRPGGRLAVAVWDSLANNRGFADKVKILEQTAGPEAAAALEMPFCLGDPLSLRDLAEEAGIGDFELRTHPGEARFPDMREFVDAELRGWLPVMNVHLNEEMIRAIHAACARRLAGYNNAVDGAFVMPTSAHIFRGIRR